MVLFWAVVTFLPDVYDVSESTFFYGKICNTLRGSKLLVCNAGLLDIQFKLNALVHSSYPVFLNWLKESLILTSCKPNPFEIPLYKDGGDI